MCRISSLFFTEAERSMSAAVRDFNIETRAIINLFPATQGVEGNTRNSERKIWGTCTIGCHRQKLDGSVQTK